ncbi:hypothetical protein [Paenibacillus sp. FSL R7-0273]|uniref:hypothetical protein n=1 Tax=Paenibacillus sp. FSL R7-0273 TaxID=1536772 RepID=UPI0006942025|nr:hypothetical protein [Paenibacillus sp. FSL R7-0273]OMF86324.1 hypothetical protein BK144_26380 [Paenibacillus sp. FSL R7-0273]
MENEPNSLIPVSGYWAEHFADKLEDGCISVEMLSKQKSVMILPYLAERYESVSLEFLTLMPNLKKLIMHADNIANYEVLKKLTGLTQLAISGSSFTESDLEYLACLEDLRKLTLVRLTLKNVHKLKSISKLKSLALILIESFDSKTIGELVNLTELCLEDFAAGDLSYISNLTKLKKLELKKVTIPHFGFMKDLKNLKTFRADTRAEDESEMTVLEELSKLEEFTYPVGDLSILQNCLGLREIGVDVSRYSGLPEGFRSNISGFTIFEATSIEQINTIGDELDKFFNLN